MTLERAGGQPPTWRGPEREGIPAERTLIVCRCGVDMQLDWPSALGSVRCFGCGARFERPPHLGPITVLPPWRPPTRAQRIRNQWHTWTRPAVLVPILLSLVAAGLLGAGVGFLLMH